MTREKIKQEVIALISELFAEKGFEVDIIEYVDLVDDLGMDSMTFISIVVELEAYFEIEIPDELLRLEEFKSIDDIVSVVEKEILTKTEKAEDQECVKT